jgi:DNA recombination protein RmuC
MFTVLVLLAILSLLNATLLGYLLYRSASTSAERMIREELRQSREDAARSARDLREEVGQRITDLRASTEVKLEATQRALSSSSHDLRNEMSRSLQSSSDSLVKTIGEMGLAHKATQDAFTAQIKHLQSVVETQLKVIQDTNDRKLEEIRRTVDEQLQTTLEKRLTESFKLVSGHLESVQRGLGEMQALATGVGDLKRVLTNVKARGTWAEYQLGAILEEILTPDQFQKNVQTNELSSERVEYAVRLPGRSGDPASCMWLPIDSKFPRESYDRLMDAQERGDVEAVQDAVAELARNIRGRAQEIQDKYLLPPATTDFGILFLPTEGLYAEVLRIPNLASDLQQKCRVMVAGPTNLAALLSSLRIGFQTLQIERRASEVWSVLRAVKTEFAKFGGVLMKVKRQLESATRTIEMTDMRTRALQRKLRDVEDLPQGAAADLLQLPRDITSLDFDLAEILVEKTDREKG